MMDSISRSNDITNLIQELSSAASKWRSIGIELGLKEVDLKSIESNHPRQPLECLRDVIIKWSSNDGWPSDVGAARRRGALIKALRSPSVEEMQLADQLTEKYSSPFPPKTITSTSVVPGVELTAKTPSTSATGSATATLTTKASAAGNTTTGSGTQATDNTKAAGKSIAAQTSETSASAKAPGKGGGSGSSSTKSGRLESTVAGLKRKKLHADNTGGDSPLLRKKLKSLDEGAVYDPPSYNIDDFVTSQPLEICCVRCKRVPRKPQRLQCCNNNLYCEPCAVATATCSVHGVGAEYKVDGILRGKISKLTVKCSNEGCEAKCAVYQMRDHLTSCKSKNDKAATSSSSASHADAKHRNIATSAKILGPVDGAEPMDVDVTSVTSLASTNQMKGVTNAGLNLQREPLQKNAGGNSEKDPTPSLSSTPTLQLPPLAEVVAPNVSSIPSLSQLQSALTTVMALMNNAAANQKGSSTPSEKQPTVTGKSEDKSKFAVPQQSLKVVTKPTNSGGVSKQVTTTAGVKQKLGAQKNISPTSAQSSPIAAQQNISTSTASSLATPPVKKTTPTLKLVPPLSLVATPTVSASENTKSPSDDSLQLGEAFTLSPSHQAKILSHTSQLHKTGAQSTGKRGAASTKASVTSKWKRANHPSHTLHTLTLPELHTELKSVAIKWRKLGHGLNQNVPGILAEIGNNPEQCLLAVLRRWHTTVTGGKASCVSVWMSLLKTLRKDAVGEMALADALQDKYGINVVIMPDKQHTQQSSSKASKPAPTNNPPPITIGALLANLPTLLATSTPPTSVPAQATPTPPKPAPQLPPTASSISRITIPPNIVTCSKGMPTVGSAMASIGQVDVFNVLKNSPVLQSIPSLRNLSGPLTANELLQKLFEVARKASPDETVKILTALQQMKPPSGAPGSATKTTPTTAVAMTTPVATPSTTPSTSKATVLVSKGKDTVNHGRPSLVGYTAKMTAPVASLVSMHKTAPIISSDTPMEADVKKGPTCTTVASTRMKSSTGLASPSKSVGPKSPMSVAVEIPKMKLSGAAITAAMAPAAALKTSTVAAATVEANASGAATSNGGSVAAGSGGDVGTRNTPQKQKQKPSSVSTAFSDNDLITLPEDAFSMKPRKEVHCSKCNHIPMNPQRPNCNCNVVYCDTCASATPNCPLCGKNQGFEEDKNMRKRIWNLKVPCSYKSQGCDWKGELCKRWEHDLVCLKRSVPCKYEGIGCGEMVRANGMSDHEEECREQHLQLAMDTVLTLVKQVKVLQDEVNQLKQI